MFPKYLSMHGSDSKESACNTGDLGLIPGLGRSPGERNGNPFQCACLVNPMIRRARWATIHGVAKSWIILSSCHAQKFLLTGAVS